VANIGVSCGVVRRKSNIDEAQVIEADRTILADTR
jgi:hypothetical protein